MCHVMLASSLSRIIQISQRISIKLTTRSHLKDWKENFILVHVGSSQPSSCKRKYGWGDMLQAGR
jgi:hypothetical protein